MNPSNNFPIVSVIIVNWNGSHHLSDCLDSLDKQIYKNFETIIIDNGSTDGSCDLIRKLCYNAKLIELDDNVGFDEGNIIGLNQAKGKYIVLLNNDTKADEKWLKNLVDYAENHPKSGIIGSVMLEWDSDIIDTAGDGCTLAGVGYKMYNGKKYSELPKNIDAFGACAGAALYTREMINKIGFLDSRFFMNLEDVDLSYRARLSGYGISICRDSFVFHRVSSSVKKVSYLSNYYASRNVELVWWKNTPSKYILASLPEKIIHLLSSTLSSIRSREKISSHLKGKIDAFRMILSGEIDRYSVQKLYNGGELRFTSEYKRIREKLS